MVRLNRLPAALLVARLGIPFVAKPLAFGCQEEIVQWWITLN